MPDPAPATHWTTHQAATLLPEQAVPLGKQACGRGILPLAYPGSQSKAHTSGALCVCISVHVCAWGGGCLKQTYHLGNPDTDLWQQRGQDCQCPRSRPTKPLIFLPTVQNQQFQTIAAFGQKQLCHL